MPRSVAQAGAGGVAAVVDRAVDTRIVERVGRLSQPRQQANGNETQRRQRQQQQLDAVFSVLRRNPLVDVPMTRK